MKFESFYSSSMGNLYCVTAANGQRLLIDPGVTWRKLQKAIDYKLDNIVGCLLTHEHKDHSKAVEDVMDAGIDVYASEGTFGVLDIAHRKAHVVEGKERFFVGKTFKVFPFDVDHDAALPLGFVVHDCSIDSEYAGRPRSKQYVKDHGEYLLFVTDTRSIKPKFGLAFSIIAICCSYDGVVLAKREATGKIDPSLAKRLLTSHMEKETTKSYIRDHCCTDKLTEIHLLHMSGDNIDKEKTRADFEKEFFTKTLIAGQAVKA